MWKSRPGKAGALVALCLLAPVLPLSPALAITAATPISVRLETRPGVSPAIMAEATRTTRQALAFLDAELGLKPAGAPVMLLTARREQYRAGLVDAGVAADLAERLAETSAGCTLERGSRVLINLEATDSLQPMSSVIAHELVHVVLHSNGINEVPRWLEEGIARLLQDRFEKQVRGERLTADLLLLARTTVRTALDRGMLKPLTADGTTHLRQQFSSTYGVQNLDLVAVDGLSRLKGGEALRNYLKRVGTAGHPQAFRESFGQGEDTWQDSFWRMLREEKATAPAPAHLRFHVDVDEGQPVLVEVATSAPQGYATSKPLGAGIFDLTVDPLGQASGSALDRFAPTPLPARQGWIVVTVRAAGDKPFTVEGAPATAVAYLIHTAGGTPFYAGARITREDGSVEAARGHLDELPFQLQITTPASRNEMDTGRHPRHRQEYGLQAAIRDEE